MCIYTITDKESSPYEGEKRGGSSRHQSQYTGSAGGSDTESWPCETDSALSPPLSLKGSKAAGM